MANELDAKCVCNSEENIDVVLRPAQNRIVAIDKRFAAAKHALADWFAGENRRLDEMEEWIRNQDEAIDVSEISSRESFSLAAGGDSKIEELMQKADTLIAASIDSDRSE